MKNFRKGLSVILVVVLMISLCSCGNPEENARKQFESLTDEIFKDSITSDTLSLHYTVSHPENYGITDYPITLGSYSEESFQEEYDDVKNWLTKLKAIEYKYLTPDQQLAYEIIEEDFSTELDAADLYLYYEPLSSISGDQLNIPILFAEYAFNTKKDISDYLALLATVDAFGQEIVDFETRKSEAGLFMADFSADEIIKQCQDFIATPDSNYLIELFDEKIDAFPDLTDAERAAFKKSNKELVLKDVVDAYNTIIDGLTTLKGTGINDGGICNFENGKEFYEYTIKSEVGTSKTINQIKKMIDSRINLNISTITSLYAKNEALFDQMEAADLTTEDYQGTLSALSEKIATDFPAGPAVTYKVKKVHPSLEESSSPAFYIVPTIDKFDANVIYVNGVTDIQTLAHEGFPGHLYQATYFASTKPANIRRLMDVSGYVEGWATYAEFNSYEMSGLDEELASALAANMSFMLGSLSLVDIGINYEGWTRQETAEYLVDMGISDPVDQSDIFETMIGSPGNYLNYYVGYLEILELKKDARNTLGSDFDVKDFHLFLLKTGPAPFDILEEQLELWLEK